MANAPRVPSRRFRQMVDDARFLDGYRSRASEPGDALVKDAFHQVTKRTARYRARRRVAIGGTLVAVMSLAGAGLLQYREDGGRQVDIASGPSTEPVTPTTAYVPAEGATCNVEPEPATDIGLDIKIDSMPVSIPRPNRTSWPTVPIKVSNVGSSTLRLFYGLYPTVAVIRSDGSIGSAGSPELIAKETSLEPGESAELLGELPRASCSPDGAPFVGPGEYDVAAVFAVSVDDGPSMAVRGPIEHLTLR